MTENVRFEQSGVMFEWDPAKAESNETKHKVTFPDAYHAGMTRTGSHVRTSLIRGMRRGSS